MCKVQLSGHVICQMKGNFRKGMVDQNKTFVICVKKSVALSLSPNRCVINIKIKKVKILLTSS